MPGDIVSAGRVTLLLPHRESFGPAAAGAVAMMVRGIAAGPSRYQSLVIGPPFDGPGFPGIEFQAARAPNWLPLTPTQRYAAKLAQVLAPLPPGLVEVHNKPDVASWLARLFPRRRVTLILHNDPRSMRGARSPRARQRLLRRLAQVVTVSEHVRRCLLEGLASPDRAPVVIHNALDLEGLPQAVPPERRDKVILFAGRVVPEKGPDAFVSACAQALPSLPGWRAEMIGADGFSPGAPDSGFIRGLRGPAAAAGVLMHGFKPRPAVLEAMARAAIVVVPSRWEEPFGLTALEAMACGAALACSRRGGLAEVAGDACEPIDPDDPASMAQALLRLARGAELRAALSAAGQERARTCFGLAQAIGKFDDLRDATLAAWLAEGPASRTGPPAYASRRAT